MIPKSILVFHCYLCEFSLLGLAFSMASTHCLWGKSTNKNNIVMIQFSAHYTRFILGPQREVEGHLQKPEHETRLGVGEGGGGGGGGVCFVLGMVAFEIAKICAGKLPF